MSAATASRPAARLRSAQPVPARSAAPAPRSVGPGPRATAPARLRRLRAFLTSGLAWGIVVSIGLAIWIVFWLGGLDYYTTPLAVRGYSAAHRVLRPSGPAGQSFGLAGTILMMAPFFYMARKRIKSLRGLGPAGVWLEVHLFCGLVGPVLVTFHTSFKFNGLISAAYWSMVLVVLSGFAGRYLYVRIPRSIRGQELTRVELEERAESLKEEISRSANSAKVMNILESFEQATVVKASGIVGSFVDLLLGEVALSRKIRALDRSLEDSGVGSVQRAEITNLSAERALVLRRTAHLLQTKKLFDLWHVFHLPLVYLLLFIAAGHIAVVLYLGYVPFRW